MKKKKSKRAKVVSKRKDGVDMISILPNPTLDQTNASSRKDKVDMINELPDPILQLILSRLPTTEEVIRTSVLSKRWRHLWTSIPWIDISYFRGPTNPLKGCEYKFAEFVYWVLAKKWLDFDSFRLCCSKYYTMSTVGRWIHIAVMNRVKVVDLMFCPKGSFQDTELPHCLVTCDSLEVLKLSLFDRRLSFPKFTGFPALRVLELSNVQLVDADLVQNFLESCPILEDLSLINCIFYNLPYLCISCPKLKQLRIDNQKTDAFLWIGVKISCPKLEFLEFLGHIADSFSIESLDSLKKAVIRPENVGMDEISYALNGYTIRGLFPQISHAEFLSLSHYFIQELDVPVSLPNLKTLELTTTLDANIMNTLVKFLRCFPDLESLHLIIQEEYSTNRHWTLGNKKKRRILVPYLKRVEFLEFKGEYSKIFMVRSLLKHAKVLEEVVFRWADLYRDESIETMKEISKFRKASSTVKLITCD